MQPRWRSGSPRIPALPAHVHAARTRWKHSGANLDCRPGGCQPEVRSSSTNVTLLTSRSVVGRSAPSTADSRGTACRLRADFLFLMPASGRDHLTMRSRDRAPQIPCALCTPSPHSMQRALYNCDRASADSPQFSQTFIQRPGACSAAFSPRVVAQSAGQCRTGCRARRPCSGTARTSTTFWRAPRDPSDRERAGSRSAPSPVADFSLHDLSVSWAIDADRARTSPSPLIGSALCAQLYRPDPRGTIFLDHFISELRYSFVLLAHPWPGDQPMP